MAGWRATHLRDGKKWLLYSLGAAYRALAGLTKAFPFSENESALSASGGGDNKFMFTSTHTHPNVLEVVKDLLLRNPHANRYVLCGKRLPPDALDYLLTDGLMPFSGNKWFWCLCPHFINLPRPLVQT